MGLFLDLLLGRTRWTKGKIPVASYQTVEFDPATMSLTEDPANQRVVVASIPSAATVVTSTTTTTATTIPAVGSSVNVAVADSSWMRFGQYIVLTDNAGHAMLASVGVNPTASTNVILVNRSALPPYTAPTGTIASGAYVAITGAQGSVVSVAGQPITPSSVTTTGDVAVGGALTVNGSGSVIAGPTQIGGTWFDKSAAVSTTDATPTVVYTLPIAASTYVDIDVSIVAADSTNSRQIRLRRLGFAGRLASGNATGLSFQAIGTDDNPSSVAVADAIFSATSMSFRVTGAAATNIRWMLWLSWRVYA